MRQDPVPGAQHHLSVCKDRAKCAPVLYFQHRTLAPAQDGPPDHWGHQGRAGARATRTEAGGEQVTARIGAKPHYGPV